MCFSYLNLQPKYLKKNRADEENMKYCLHVKWFKNKIWITLYQDQLVEGAWCLSVLIIHIIIITTIAVSIVTSFVISYFIFMINIFIVTMFHDCIINFSCDMRNMLSIKPFNITVDQFKPIIKYSWVKDLPQQISYITSLCTMIFCFSPLAPVYMVETNTDQHIFRVATIFGKWNSRIF